MSQHIKRIAVLATLLLVFSIASFHTLEPTYLGAVTDNVAVSLTVDEEITISNGADITMANNISVSTSESTGSSSWTVTTNSDDGYNLAVSASTNPALRHSGFGSNGYHFGNFALATSTPVAWDTGKGSSTTTFGYSAYGTDTPTGTWGAGATCGGASSIPTNMNYAGTTSSKVIATRANVTPTTGIATTFCVGAEQVGVFAAAGAYSATITGTAVVN